MARLELVGQTAHYLYGEHGLRLTQAYASPGEAGQPGLRTQGSRGVSWPPLAASSVPRQGIAVQTPSAGNR
jgi:hypothetical protein